jgi:hypothetical protein
VCRFRLALLAFAALFGGACAAKSPDAFGRSVTLVPREDRQPATKGELLAVGEQSLWVRTVQGVREVDTGSLREVRVKRHTLNGSWARRWGFVGGLASGIALGASCSAVEGNDAGDCARVGAVSAALWVAVGLLAAPGLESSSGLTLRPDERERLRPYARFPAGLPKKVEPQSLAAGPPGPR